MPSENSTVSVAEVIADELVRAGVTTVYGLPGGENVHVLDAMRRRGLDFVLVKNESSACFMADVTARLTGRPGVALTTLGPGATNAYVGLAHAYLDRAPVLLITAESEPHLVGTHTHQLLDLQACMGPVSKMSISLDEQTPRATARRALLTAQAGRPGPVHLSVSNGTAARPALDADDPLPERIHAPRLQEAALDAARRHLAAARRPVIVAGLGLEPERPYAALRQLAERLDAPVIDTPKAKGALPAGHPLFAGTIGLSRTDPVYDVLDDADCIVAVGFDVVELVKPWRQPQPLIWAAGWPNVDPAIPAASELVGPLTPTLAALADLAGQKSDADWGAARVAAFRADLAGEQLPAPAPGRFLPQALLAALAEVAPDNLILTTDVGSHKIFTALNWPAPAPNRYFLSNGLSAMGFGITAAVAAARVTGDPVLCITGDAGAAMVLSELALAVERQLPVIVVLMNDAALDLIRSAQTRAGRSVFGTEFTNPDYSLLAAGYGLDYAVVRSAEEFGIAVKSGLDGGKPLLIDAFIDPVGYPTTVR